jgi:predicted Zn-dependent protease
VLAHGVVHGAARHAQRRAEEARSADMPAARGALTAAQRSKRDFDAVDNGGRDAVWL